MYDVAQARPAAPMLAIPRPKTNRDFSITGCTPDQYAIPVPNVAKMQTAMSLVRFSLSRDWCTVSSDVTKV